MNEERPKPLTARELEIIALIGAGMDSRRIADALGIAYFTVRKHRSNILSKLQLSTSAQLAAYAAATAQSSICPALVSTLRGRPSVRVRKRSPVSSRAALPARKSAGF